VATKKTTKKAPATKAKASNGKYSFLDSLLEGVVESTSVNKKGEVVLKKSDLKQALEASLLEAGKAAARGEKVRLPVIGTLMMKDVAARKAGKALNRFTGEMVDVAARPASRKPRWSFPKSLKDLFADKKNWK
jgi:nucleoid DNA-binding protein